jgi:hypothetical protein
VHDAKSVKPPEVAHIDRQDLANAMSIHASGKPGVMHLHALNTVSHQKSAPPLMNVPAISQELEISLNDPGQAVRLGHGQAEAILIGGPGRGVPEFSERLRGIAQPRPWPTMTCSAWRIMAC